MYSLVRRYTNPVGEKMYSLRRQKSGASASENAKAYISKAPLECKDQPDLHHIS